MFTKIGSSSLKMVKTMAKWLKIRIDYGKKVSMDAHLVNNPDPTPDPSPNSSNLERGATSLAVLQFVALARGEWSAQVPCSPFRVERVTEERRYCLGCCRVRVHDVVKGQRSAFGGQLLEASVVICRSCGEEGLR